MNFGVLLSLVLLRGTAQFQEVTGEACQIASSHFDAPVDSWKQEKLVFASVDIDEYPDLASELSVKAIPSLRLFRGDQKSSEYFGDLDADSVQAWMRKRFGGGVQYLASVEDSGKFLAINPRACIGYFPNHNGRHMVTFRYLESVVGDIAFAYTSEEIVVASVSLKSESVKIVAKGSEKIIASGLDDAHALFRTITLWSSPQVIAFDSLSARTVFSSPSPVLFVLSEAEITLDSETAETVREFGLLLSTVRVHPDSPVHAHLLELLGAPVPEPSETQLFILEDPRKPLSRKFRSPVFSVLTSDAVRQFVSAFAENLLEPYLKSEPAESLSPRIFEAVPLAGVSLLNFLEIPLKDKLVLFYAPWCSFCVAAVEAIDSLSREVADTRLLVAKMDVSRNDPPGLPIDRVPVLYLFPSSGGRTEYSGEFSAPSIKEWVSRLKAHGDL